MKVIIVGGVAGGASAAARLRRLDEHAEIILLERGRYISYANCGLPYHIGGEIVDQAALTVQTPDSFRARFHIDVRTEQEAVSIHPAKKLVDIRNLSSNEVYTESYDKLILSPGAEAIKPAWSAISHPQVFTLRTIPDTLAIKQRIAESKAKTAVIIGGGYIGVEMAENLSRAGLSVSIVERSDHLIAPLDFDMACDVHHYLRSKGVTLHLNVGVQDLRAKDAGVEVVLPNGVLAADLVILSIGVQPESALAKAAGLSLSDKGAILVDAQMRSSDENIYAVGDAVQVTHFVSQQPGYLPLAGPANKQGRIAADHICGIDASYEGTQGSAIARVFDLTIASSGLNESALQANQIDYDKVYTFSSAHATYYPGATNLCIKLLFAPSDGRILGAQVVGFGGVDKRCDILATAIRAKLTVYDLCELELCYAPPFSSAKDPVNMAGFAAENVLEKLVRQFFWQDVPAIQKREDCIILDVRNAPEVQNGRIDGSIHIPLDQLRDRLGELERGKELYVHCQSGLRSYLACRILWAHGFSCWNLAGGYRLYESVTRTLDFDDTPKHACGLPI